MTEPPQPQPPQQPMYAPAPWPYPGYPPPQPPPPRRRTGLFIAIGAGAFVVVALIVTGAVILLGGTLVTKAPEAAAPSSASTSPGTDLSGILLKPPAGAEKSEPFGSPDGTVSLAELASMYGNVRAETDSLELLQYTQGASVGWKLSDGSIVTIGLFHFALQRSSVAFVADNAYWYSHPPGDWVAKRLTDVPAGNYYLSAKADPDGYLEANAWFFKGNIAGWVAIGRQGTVDEAALTKLAQDQYARLP